MKKLITILFSVALGLNLSAQNDCNLYGDLDGDSLVTINDLMGILSAFGTDYNLIESVLVSTALGNAEANGRRGIGFGCSNEKR